MATSEADVAAKLIERLLADPAFRTKFRRDPAAACREAGLEELAREMSVGGGKAMYTLDMRESKSSLAGVMMAAAMEGVGIYQFTENVLPHLEEVPRHVADVLSRVDLPALPGMHHGGGGGGAAGLVEAHPPPDGGGGGAGLVEAQSPPDGGRLPDSASGAALDTGGSAPPPPPPVEPPAAAADKAAAAAEAKPAPPPEAVAPKASAAKKAARRIADAMSPRTARRQAVSDAAAALDSKHTGLPESSALPSDAPVAGSTFPDTAAPPTGTPGGAADAVASAPSAPSASGAPAASGAAPGTPGAPAGPGAPGAPAGPGAPGAPAGPGASAADAPPGPGAPAGGGAPAAGSVFPSEPSPKLQATDATAPPETVVHHAAAAAHVAPAHHPVDPAQFGAEGTGGTPDAETLALLHNKHVILDASGMADLKSGRVDPRVVGVLTKLSHEHKLTISAISSNHSKFTAGGSVSNHHLGRGVDIAAIDGQPVNAGNPIARDVASELSSLDPAIRPNEIGSPWAISGPGYFTDAAHQNHLHIGFKQPIDPSWTPPADVAAPGDQAAAGGVAAPGDQAATAAAASATPAPPAPAVAPAPADVPAAPAAAAPAPVAPAGPPPKDSQIFLQALGAKAAAAHQAARAKDSQMFLQAVEPKPAAPAAGPVAAAAAQPAAPGAGAEAAAASFTGGSTTYPGDNASQAQIAAWMGAEAQKRGLPPELPVMASLVESGVKNLHFGDRDSVGFFQMRVNTWNSGPYAGFPDKPELQVKWFLDQAEAVKTQRISRGQSVTDPHEYGNWIADIERPAEQYRYRYGLRLGEAQGLLARHAPAPPPVEPQPQGHAAAAAAEAAQPAAGGHHPIDPAQFGAEGTGGTPDAETLALLHNKNVILDANGVADLKAGRIDPRVVGVLTKLSHDHKLTISCTCSDHPKFTTGGSVSNHHLGRGVDIAAVDGQPVNAGNPIARDLASELSSLDPAIRPNEIGSPWAISGPGYFTDAAHQNHLHIGFKQAIDPNWTPPADVAAPGDQAAAAAAVAPAGAPAAAVVPGAPAPVAAAAAPAAGAPPKDSQMFLQALGPKAAGANAAARAKDSQMFLQAVDPKPAAAPVASAATAGTPGAGAVVDAAAAGAPGGGGGSLGAAALQIAETQKGVREIGSSNTGPQVDHYLAAAGVAPGNPWCASFVTWSLQQAGHKMPGSGWAGVATWVHNAQQGANGLQIVSADQARPGDIVAYDWGGGNDFGGDGHIGFLASGVKDGQFNALEGNNADAVNLVPRHLGGGPNIVFIRVQGDAPAGAGAPPVDPGHAAAAVQPAPAAAVQSAPARVAQPAPAPAVQPAPAALAADPAAAAERIAQLRRAHLPPQVEAALETAFQHGQVPGPKALGAVEEASKHLGTPYHWGGSTPQTGFDCSGLMQWAYAHVGIQTPRVSEDQILAANATPVDRTHLHPGDLVFFRDGGDVHHVGMSLGGDMFLHAPHTGDVVKVSSLKESYYAQQFTGGRRFDNSAPVEGVAGQPAAAPVAAAAEVQPAGAPAGAAAAVQPAGAPPVDAAEVARAQSRVARDAAEVRRNDSQLFQAIVKQETNKNRSQSVMFLKAIDPSQVNRPAASAAAAAPPPGAVATAPPPPEAVSSAAAPAPAAADLSASIDLTHAAAEYPGDNASQAELARWLAKQAQKAGLPPELPVMASLVESGVKNINYGDRDSVGFFQMRTETWNHGLYAGYPQKPELQAKWFIDSALAVKRKAIAAGDANFGKDPSKFGEWIADVERPAEQYRGRYQLRLDQARGLLRS